MVNQQSGQWFNVSTGQGMSSAFSPGEGWKEVSYSSSRYIPPIAPPTPKTPVQVTKTFVPPPPTALQISMKLRREKAETQKEARFPALARLRMEQEAKKEQYVKTRKWGEKDIREHPLEYAFGLIPGAGIVARGSLRLGGKVVRPLSQLIGKTKLAQKVVPVIKKAVTIKTRPLYQVRTKKGKLVTGKIQTGTIFEKGIRTLKFLEPEALKGLAVAIGGSTAYAVKTTPQTTWYNPKLGYSQSSINKPGKGWLPSSKAKVLSDTSLSLARSGFAFGLGTVGTKQVLNLQYFDIKRQKPGVDYTPPTEKYPKVEKGSPKQVQKKVLSKYDNADEILHATTSEFGAEALLKLPPRVRGSEVKAVYGFPVKEPGFAFFKFGDYKLAGLPKQIIPKIETRAKFLKIDVGKISKAPITTLKKTQKFVESMMGKGKTFVLGYGKTEVEAIIPFLNKIKKVNIKPSSKIRVKGQDVPVYDYKLVKSELTKVSKKDLKKALDQLKKELKTLKKLPKKKVGKLPKKTSSSRGKAPTSYAISPQTALPSYVKRILNNYKSGAWSSSRSPKGRETPRPEPPRGEPPRTPPPRTPPPSRNGRPYDRPRPPRPGTSYRPLPRIDLGATKIMGAIMPLKLVKPITAKKRKAELQRRLKYTKTIISAKQKVKLRYFTGVELR